jgi:hypothetical protein
MNSEFCERTPVKSKIDTHLAIPHLQRLARESGHSAQ